MQIGLPIVSAIITIIVWIFVAMMFKSSVTDQRNSFPSPPSAIAPQWNMSDKDFMYRWSQCCADTQYCLHGCCCFDVRMADSYATAGIIGYWSLIGIGFLFFFIGYVMYGLVGFGLRQIEISDGMSLGQFAGIGYYLPQILFAAFMAKKRGQLREKFGGRADQCGMDFCCWWWCACCMVIQEARQIDEATSARVECCCKLLKSGPLVTAANVGMVGQPIAVGQVVVGAPQPITVISPGKDA